MPFCEKRVFCWANHCVRANIINKCCRILVAKKKPSRLKEGSFFKLRALVAEQQVYPLFVILVIIWSKLCVAAAKHSRESNSCFECSVCSSKIESGTLVEE